MALAQNTTTNAMTETFFKTLDITNTYSNMNAEEKQIPKTRKTKSRSYSRNRMSALIPSSASVAATTVTSAPLAFSSTAAEYDANANCGAWLFLSMTTTCTTVDAGSI